jgi:DNA-binding response OmpR family regulator
MADPTRQGSESPTVLVLEPDIVVRHGISEYLRDCGYTVIETASGDEAMLVLKASGMRIAVLLADATAPGAPDGFGLAQWVRANRSGIDVILTGTPERAAKEAGDLCEAGPTLSKPYDPQVMVDRIKRLQAARKRATPP